MQELKAKYRPKLKNEKIEALFLFQAGTVWASLDSVYKKCLNNEEFSVRLVLVTETTVETSHMKNAEAFLIQNGMEYELFEDVDWQYYRPHVVFIQFPYDAAFHSINTLSLQFKRRGIRVIYIPYGIEISNTQIAIKDHFFPFVVENAWRIYVSSKGIKEEYDKYCHNRQAVRVTGSPKFDSVHNKSIFTLNDEIKERAEGRRIVVWKMHFPKKINENGAILQITPFMSEYIDFANGIDEYSDLFFVILAHPKMLRGVVASDIQGDDSLVSDTCKLFSILKEKNNVCIDVTDDYRNTFYNADAIVMDRSGVMIEAAMLDVPVLFMKNQYYSECFTSPVANVVDGLEHGMTCQDMRDFIEGIQKNIDSNKEKRNELIMENFPLSDGKCADRIIDDIVNSLTSLDDGDIKVVLYGVGAICNYYVEGLNWKSDKRFKLVAIADSDPDKIGCNYHGYTIVSAENLKYMDYDAIVITTEPHYFEIKKKLVYDIYLDERKIWRLDEFVLELDKLEN